MSAYGQETEAVVAARVALATREPPEPDVVEAVADGLLTVPAPLHTVPYPRTVRSTGASVLARRRA